MTRPDLPFYLQQRPARRRRRQWCMAVVLLLALLAMAMFIGYVRVP